jgi:diguanylate cyclase (GGDEF)-like protein/PAS domain S-box-containing protein
VNTSRGPGLDPVALLDALPDSAVVCDTEGHILFASEAAFHVFGWKPVEWVGRAVTDVVHPDDLALVLTSLGSIQNKVRGTPVEVRIRDAAGDWRLVEVVGTNALTDEGVGALVMVGRDITDRRRWEVAGGDVERFQRIVQVAASLTLLLDRDGMIVTSNAAFTRSLGHDPAKVNGRLLSSFVVPRHAPDLERALAALLARDEGVPHGGHISLDLPMLTAGPDVDVRPFRFEFVDALDDPVVQGIVVTGHDVTEMHSMKRELEHLARHDPLTRLPNRSMLSDRLQRLLEFGETFAVLFIDLDRFKPINDLYGHEAGDQVLSMVAERLRDFIRPNDLVARVGGDEFVVVAHGIATRDAARRVSDRMEMVLSVPYHLDMGPLRVGASVGISVVDEGSTVTSMLAEADMDMYDAKTSRRGLTPRSKGERHRTVIERRRMAEECLSGLSAGEFVAHLQPIVDLRTGEVVRLEALARWHHPRHGLLVPAGFADLVEDAGLDEALGEIVLDSACATLARLERESGVAHHLAVNMSVSQLSDPLLCHRVQAIVSRHDIAVSRLVVEITEQGVLAQHVRAGGVLPERSLAELCELGASVSLDDFGTGAASLNQLQRLPLSDVKIDTSFIDGMGSNRRHDALVRAIIALAGSLGLRVVAEGIETSEQLATLRELGCDLGQGQYFVRPLASDELVRWLLARAGAGAPGADA